MKTEFHKIFNDNFNILERVESPGRSPCVYYKVNLN